MIQVLNDGCPLAALQQARVPAAPRGAMTGGAGMGGTGPFYGGAGDASGSAGSGGGTVPLSPAFVDFVRQCMEREPLKRPTAEALLVSHAPRTSTVLTAFCLLLTARNASVSELRSFKVSLERLLQSLARLRAAAAGVLLLLT